MDLMSIDVELHLMHGDNRKLADWINTGRPLTPVMQKYVVDMLRRDLQASKGTVRTWPQITMERSHISAIRQRETTLTYIAGMERLEIKDLGQADDLGDVYRAGLNVKGINTKALDDYAEDMGISVNTLKGYIRKSKKTGCD